MGYQTNTVAGDLRIGDIVWAPCVSTQLNLVDELTKDTCCDFGWVDSTGAICGKKRAVIAQAIFQSHIIGLPIYTSGGKGLEDRTDVSHVGLVRRAARLRI